MLQRSEWCGTSEVVSISSSAMALLASRRKSASCNNSAFTELKSSRTLLVHYIKLLNNRKPKINRIQAENDINNFLTMATTRKK